MLTHLHIRDYLLIDSLDIDFHTGFSVITGQTGAGKSIILGAIALITGGRADSKTIRPGAAKCVIEAEFDKGALIVRREIAATGKSRAFIDDSPVQLAELKTLGERLLDIHSQHKNLLLAENDFQLEVLDTIADDRKALDNYKDTYRKLAASRRALDELRRRIADDSEKADFMRFQHDELASASLDPGEQEQAEAEVELMSHAEEIKSALYTAADALSADGHGITTQLRTALDAMRQQASVLPEAGALAERMDSCLIELKDIAAEVEERMDATDFDPARLDALQARLDTLYGLEKKYHCANPAELIAKRDALARSLGDIDNSDEALAAKEAECAELEKHATALAAKLTAARKAAADKVAATMQDYLARLGMPKIVFRVDMEPIALATTGADKATFLMAANSGMEPQPIAAAASGGEIARVMLSLKAMISGAVKLPTIIFDEIDTGVSGKIAEQMAVIMRQMGSQGRQVISITHLPQIAATGQWHYRVSKSDDAGATTTTMQELSRDERIAEIAQMLSGSDITAAAMENARQLLRI